MSKDIIFKMRLREKDRARLDALTEHYSASAATIVKILIVERFDAIEKRYLTAGEAYLKKRAP